MVAVIEEGERSMYNNSPFFDHERIARAAEAMIANHGRDALAEAERRVQTLQSAGCDEAVATWLSIRSLIQTRIDGYSF